MATRTLDQWLKTTDLGFLYWNDTVTKKKLELGEFINIGRDPSNQLVLGDEFTSGRHARIEKKPIGYLFRDLQSRNGSYLNGAKVIECWLTDGDRIKVGSTELTFSHQKELNSVTSGSSSKNEKWNEQLLRLPTVAQSNLPVLLNGPSGTGKEVLALNLHRLSSRADNPFVSVNCSALTDSLVESELFGHLRGSFTGATCDRKGAFEAARGGTLFLDEIGDLPLQLQPKLLRALENQQIRPVGSDRSINTDVRIIAATHHNLKQKVYEEKFREDLYFRLHVIQFQTPRLRDRPEDFEDLLYFFAKQQRISFTYGAIQKLKTHSWPGNIRELKNTVARAKAFFPQGNITESQALELLEQPFFSNPNREEGHLPRNVIKEMEQEMIVSRLLANRGNQRKTALELGIPKSTLHDRIKRYSIDISALASIGKNEDLGF